MFAPILAWIFRGVVIKFVVLTAIFSVLTLLIPLLTSLVAPYFGGSSLTSAFSGLDSGTWYFLDFFALDYGIPIVLSAYVARFLIRRIPFIG